MAARPILVAILSLAALVNSARADDDFALGADDLRDDILTPPPERYTIQFEPSVFYAAPGGKLRLPGSPAGTDYVLLENLDLDVPRISPFAELHYRSDNWRLSLSGFDVQLHDRGSVQMQPGAIGPITFNPGDQLTSDITFATGEAVVARELGVPESVSGKHDPDFCIGFEVYGGFRFYDVSFDIQGPGASANADEFFIQPIGGIKSTMSVINKVTIDVQLGAGGFYEGEGKYSYSFDILVGFMYRPVENIGVQIGYRLFIYDLQDGPTSSRFEYRGAVAGLYGGLVVRF